MLGVVPSGLVSRAVWMTRDAMSRLESATLTSLVSALRCTQGEAVGAVEPRADLLAFMNCVGALGCEYVDSESPAVQQAAVMGARLTTAVTVWYFKPPRR